ncbi:MAG: ATP synthase F1 subunit epsilon [Bacteroidales bacterium]|nr:ATP synthase F1 subunit epsilon [Bacteroidales bacterium]
MFLEIITPEKIVFSGEINLIKVPGSKGSFEVLKNHAPLISTLEKGDIKVLTNTDEEKHFSIDGGVIEVRDNKIIVLGEFV